MGAHQGGLESPQVNQPKYLNHLPEPQYCKSRCYLPAEGTLTLMTSGEKGENGEFWEQLEKLEPTKGPGIVLSVSNIFQILNLSKSVFISTLGAQQPS
jgi:hypothetical protein